MNYRKIDKLLAQRFRDLVICNCIYYFLAISAILLLKPLLFDKAPPLGFSNEKTWVYFILVFASLIYMIIISYINYKYLVDKKLTSPTIPKWIFSNILPTIILVICILLGIYI